MAATRINVIWFRFETATAKLVIWSNKKATLSSLFSKERRKGHASGLMNKIVEFAEENELILDLEVGRFGKVDNLMLDNNQLVDFYKKFGFEKSPNKKNLKLIMRRQLLKGNTNG